MSPELMEKIDRFLGRHTLLGSLKNLYHRVVGKTGSFLIRTVFPLPFFFSFVFTLKRR